MKFACQKSLDSLGRSLRQEDARPELPNKRCMKFSCGHLFDGPGQVLYMRWICPLRSTPLSPRRAFLFPIRNPPHSRVLRTHESSTPSPRTVSALVLKATLFLEPVAPVSNARARETGPAGPLLLWFAFDPSTELRKA
jgi:hypothetical protein